MKTESADITSLPRATESKPSWRWGEFDRWEFGWRFKWLKRIIVNIANVCGDHAYLVVVAWIVPCDLPFESRSKVLSVTYRVTINTPISVDQLTAFLRGTQSHLNFN